MAEVGFQQARLCTPDGVPTGVIVESRWENGSDGLRVVNFGVSVGATWVYSDQAFTTEKREMILALLLEAANCGRHGQVAALNENLEECDQRIAAAIYDPEMFAKAMLAVGEKP